MVAKAQQPQHQQNRFDPQKFQMALESYITREAKLTQKEAAAFFPLYKKLQSEQRALFQKGSKARWVKPATEHDNIDLQIKKLQKQYHQKFLKVVSASKLYDILKAEDRFHKQSIRKFTERVGKPHRK